MKSTFRRLFNCLTTISAKLENRLDLVKSIVSPELIASLADDARALNLVDVVDNFSREISRDITVEEVAMTTDDVPPLCDLGKVMVRCGLVQISLLAPQGPVDPAERKNIKVKYTEEEVRDFRNFRASILTFITALQE